MIKLNPAKITLLNHALVDGTIDLAYDNYIYDLEDEDEIFKNVVNALQNGAPAPIQDNGTKWNQKIIEFPGNKNRSNAVKSTFNPFSLKCG